MARKVHLLDSAPGYDVSHSEPEWHHRIWVSVPDRADEVGALRFAEGVIHEAMHLELTQLELDRPMIEDGTAMMQSPWRDELRPIGGVLHGLFVFACLETAIRIMSFGVEGLPASHARRRRHDIRAEVASIDVAILVSGLTPFGAELVRSWIHGVLSGDRDG